MYRGGQWYVSVNILSVVSSVSQISVGLNIILNEMLICMKESDVDTNRKLFYHSRNKNLQNLEWAIYNCKFQESHKNYKMKISQLLPSGRCDQLLYI